MTRAKLVMVLTSVSTELKSNWQPEITSLFKAALKLGGSKVGEWVSESGGVREGTVQVDVCLFVGLNFPVE
jgi:hypothetical protein